MFLGDWDTREIRVQSPILSLKGPDAAQVSRYLPLSLLINQLFVAFSTLNGVSRCVIA